MKIKVHTYICIYFIFHKTLLNNICIVLIIFLDHIVINPREGVLKFEHTLLTDTGVYWCEVFTASGLSIKSHPAILSITGKYIAYFATYKCI